MNEKDMHRYQKQGANHICEFEGAGLFMEMGLGKTVTTLTAVNFLMYHTLEISKTLVIGPLRVARQVWDAEIKNWEHLRHLRYSKVLGTAKERIKALQQDADIYIINMENVPWLVSYLKVGGWVFDMVVVDESDQFKSARSSRFKALKIVRSRISRLVALTGTPQSHSLLDLWSQLYLMDQGKRLFPTVTEYKAAYFSAKKIYGASSDNATSYKPLPSAKELIYEKIGDICLSMKAKDYLQLPPLTSIKVEIPITRELQNKYDDFEREKVLELLDSDEITAQNAATLSIKLLQFANGAIYDDDRVVRAIHQLKIQALIDIMESANSPVLCIYAYKHDRSRIEKYLRKYKPRHLKDDQDFKDWNDGKIRLALGHPKSMGHGLNMQAGGHTIVIFGNTWQLGLKLQVIARLHRQGQLNGVIVHNLCLMGTIDERVLASNDERENEQESLMEYCKALKRKYLK